MNNLLENRLPSIEVVNIGRSEFDRYDFCRLIDEAVQDRDVSYIGLIQRTSDLENANPEMTFVKNARLELPGISDRALFYEICYDYFNGNTSNIDSTLERRFLFKIELKKPSVEAKRKIWMDKLPSLTEADATMLADNFDFSGGEIDNIVRKATMQEVLEGTVPEIGTMMRLCREEKLSHNQEGNSRRIGF